MIWHFCHTILVPVRRSMCKSAHRHIATYLNDLTFLEVYCLSREWEQAKPKVTRSVQFGIVALRLAHWHFIRIPFVRSPLLWCRILLQNNIFAVFFLGFSFAFVGTKEMDFFLLFGFTFHCLFKYSFNLVNVLASGVCVRAMCVCSMNSRTGTSKYAWRRRRAAASVFTQSFDSFKAHVYTRISPRERDEERWRNDRKYLLSQIDEIACVLVSLNGSCANASAQSYHILLHHFEYNICFWWRNSCKYTTAKASTGSYSFALGMEHPLCSWSNCLNMLLPFSVPGTAAHPFTEVAMFHTSHLRNGLSIGEKCAAVENRSQRYSVCLSRQSVCVWRIWHAYFSIEFKSIFCWRRQCDSSPLRFLLTS